MEAAEQNKLIEQHPILAELKEAREIVWINPDKVIEDLRLLLFSLMLQQTLQKIPFQHHMQQRFS